MTTPPTPPLATFRGQPTDRGRVVVGRQYPGEGYAVIRCGGTEVQVGYTLLHHAVLLLDPNSPVFGDIAELQNALDSITAEASIGRTGDTPAPPPP